MLYGAGSMAAALRLYLDLGDLFTKAVVVDPPWRRRLRFPSVVARRLLDDRNAAGELLIDEQQPLQRPVGFDAAQYARTRSYPGAEAVLGQVRDQAPVTGARYAGWQATTFGVDREVLGIHPTAQNVDALVHKALILTKAASGRDVQVVFVLDAGAKAETILRYAEQSPRTAAFEVHSLQQREPRRVELEVRSRVVDAADCAAAALPSHCSLHKLERLLLIDIGYFRTKLAIVSSHGCEHQEQLDSVGVSDCVKRILRDGQDRGLVEDEFAVIHALEKSAPGALQVAGRRFAVTEPLRNARDGLEQELERAARRTLLGYFGRRARLCRGAVVLGGGVALVGEGLLARLRASEVGLSQAWAAADPSFFLLDGAEQVESATR
jgi:hypothetical protein